FSAPPRPSRKRWRGASGHEFSAPPRPSRKRRRGASGHGFSAPPPPSRTKVARASGHAFLHQHSKARPEARLHLFRAPTHRSGSRDTSDLLESLARSATSKQPGPTRRSDPTLPRPSFSPSAFPLQPSAFFPS